MKSLLAKTLFAGCLMAVVAVGFAADEKKKNEKKKPAAPSPAAGILKKLETAGIPADVIEKAKAAAAEHGPKIAAAQAKLNSQLTDDQKKAQSEAQKAAKAAGKKGKDAQVDIDAATKLTDEQKKGIEEAKKELQTAQADLNKAIAALLSDEQKEKLGLAPKKKEKKKTE